MAQKFKTGDVVNLKSGSPDMTVMGYQSVIDIEAIAYRQPARDLGESTMVKCTWFEGKKPRANSYHEDLLDLVRAAAQ